ncbi:MAG TPA: alpha/beta hydrolase [Solirubrobacterales bacterium]|nr:alpha/beta hydrolase [Solirubrobacterales bacterium]
MTELTVELPQGTIEYRDEGQGPAIVFSHGIFVDSSLWDGLVERLVPAGFRCIRPQTPMGCHRIPMKPDADLSPPGIADLLADFIDALELGSVPVVGSDSGGAVAQMLAARHPEKVSALILANCDALEVYPPVPFNLLPYMARMPGGIAPLGAAMRLRPVRWAAYRLLAVDPIPDRQLKAWLAPSSRNPGIRGDVNRLLGGVEKSQTFEAAEKLRGFDRPVLLVWGDRDRIFKPDLAERLAAMIPDARIEPVEGGRTFVMLDRPDEVSRRIADFLGSRMTPAHEERAAAG